LDKEQCTAGGSESRGGTGALAMRSCLFRGVQHMCAGGASELKMVRQVQQGALGVGEGWGHWPCAYCLFRGVQHMCAGGASELEMARQVQRGAGFWGAVEAGVLEASLAGKCGEGVYLMLPRGGGVLWGCLHRQGRGALPT
jgi:hypothetical protein